MNFQTLSTTREKQYIQLVAVVVTSFGPPTPKQWKNGDISYETECQCTDGPGQSQTVYATSKFPEPVFDANDINKAMDWKMKWFNTQQGAKVCGYPLKPTKRQQFTNQQAPQPQQQPNFNPARQPQPAGGAIPYTPPQQTYTPVQQPKPRDYDKENRGKCRFGLYQACLQAGLPPVGLVEDWTILNAIEILVGYSMDGLPPHDEDGAVPPFIANSPVQYDPDNPPDDNVPV